MPNRPCLGSAVYPPGHVLVRGGSRCRECASQYQRERDQRRGSASQRGYGEGWRKVRAEVLERDGWQCQHCGKPANTVDHVVPLAAGGSRLDPSNLVASCRSCNSRRGGATRRPGGGGPT